jgi:hypothetical protein
MITDGRKSSSCPGNTALSPISTVLSMEGGSSCLEAHQSESEEPKEYGGIKWKTTPLWWK